MTLKISKMGKPVAMMRFMAHAGGAMLPQLGRILDAAGVKASELQRLARRMDKADRDGAPFCGEQKKYNELVHKVLAALVDSDEIRRYTASAISRHRKRLKGLEPWIWVGPSGELLEPGGFKSWKEFVYDECYDDCQKEMMILLLATVDEMSRGIEVEAEFPEDFCFWHEELAPNCRDYTVTLRVLHNGGDGMQGPLAETFIAW